MDDTYTVEVSALVAAEIKAEAQVLGIPEGQVVARWYGMSTTVGGAVRAEAEPWAPLRLHAVYRGVRIDAVYVPATHRVAVLSGPVAGRNFKSPTGAARAVVEALNPGRTAVQGNGWRFWRITATDERLDVCRTVRGKPRGRAAAKKPPPGP